MYFSKHFLGQSFGVLCVEVLFVDVRFERAVTFSADKLLPVEMAEDSVLLQEFEVLQPLAWLLLE